MKSNYNITLLISSLGGGGAEKVCVNIANRFADSGWKVDLVVLNLMDKSFLADVSKKINLVVLNVNQIRHSSIPLANYIFKNKTKVVLVFNHELAVILAIVRILLRLKIIIISRNISVLSIKIKQYDSQNFFKKNIIKPLVKYFYRKIDYVINQSENMRDDLISVFPQFLKNSCVIYNPISIQITDYANKFDFNKIEKKNYILCVGRLERVKGFDLAIEGFAGISKRFPNLRLKIVGNGKLKNDLKKKAIEYGVFDKIDFEGFQNDIIPYYLYAKATILTSLYEGYPNVLIESIAMNTPVVAFNCPGGTNEIVKNGLNGHLVNNQDISDLKEKISITLTNNFDYDNLKNSINANQTNKVFKKYEKLISSYI